MAFIIGEANDADIQKLRSAGFDEIITLTPQQKFALNSIFGEDAVGGDYDADDPDTNPLIAIYVDCDLVQLVETTVEETE